MKNFPQLFKTKTGLLTNLIMAGVSISTAISYSNIALAITNNNPIKQKITKHRNLSKTAVGAGSPTPVPPTNITDKPAPTTSVPPTNIGAGSPTPVPPTNITDKPAPTTPVPPTNIINKPAPTTSVPPINIINKPALTTLNQTQNRAGLLLPQPIAQQPTPPPVSPELQKLQQQYLLTEPATLEVPTLGAAAAPGSSSGSPTAFGASWGKTFAGIGFQGRTRYTDDADGSISVGMGFGDAQKSVGVEVTLAVLSLFGDDAFERGGFSFKVHRQLPENFAVALGIENAIVWGGTDAGSSIYGVVSKIFPLKEKASEPFSQITASLGLGGGRFRSENDINNDEGSVNIFGSIGVRVAEPVSIIADWTGQDLTLGASIAPFKDIPLVITPAIADITGNAGDGARFILGIGYNYSFPTGNK